MLTFSALPVSAADVSGAADNNDNAVIYSQFNKNAGDMGTDSTTGADSSTGINSTTGTGSSTESGSTGSAAALTASESEYTGAGMCIALLGSGFLVEHESFRVSGEPKLTEEYIKSLSEDADLSSEKDIDSPSEDTMSDDSTSEDTASDNSPSEDTASDDSPSEDTASDDSTSEDTASDDSTSEDSDLSSEAAGTHSKLNARLPEGQPDASFYISPKIPFAYNYADDTLEVGGIAQSGTALLYAATGNPTGSAHAAGIAPDAQVLAMKIASDNTGMIDESAAARAVEDAITLGADVICVAISDPCGFDDDTTELGMAIAKAETAGIPVIAAVGDVGALGKESAYYDAYAMSAPETTHPDTGMVSYPASLDEVLGAGSAHTNTLTAHCLIFDGGVIPYSDSNHLYQATGGMSFSEYFGGQTLEYVFVDGLGEPEDFVSAGDLVGKLAIIDRGELNFSEKAANAAAMGAIGVIIRDNQPDPNQTLNLICDLTGSPIPLIIAASQYVDLLNRDGGSLYVSPDEIYTVKLFDTPYPSDFTASGPTPELSLGIDVAYIAESVETLGSDGSYYNASGTALAAARLSGALAVAKQRLTTEQPGLSSAEAGKKARALVVSSAELMTQTGSSIPYSPRLQGGGVVSVDALVDCGLILTSDGDYKIELGELGGRWMSFELTVENLRGYPVDCTLDFIIGSDGWREFSYSELMYDDGGTKTPLHERLGMQPDDRIAFTTDFVGFDNLSIYVNDNLISDDMNDGYEFSLGANSEYTFDVTIYIDEETYDEYRRVFGNGFFAEGYAKVSAVNPADDGDSDNVGIADGDISATDDIDVATIPIIGFCGSWYDEPALDADIYDHAEPIIDGRWLYRLYASNAINSTVVLGTNPFLFGLDGNLPDRNLICYSPNVDLNNEGIYLNFGLRRSVSGVRVTVTNSDGEVVYSADRGDCARTYVNSNGMMFTAQLPLWNARAGDNRYYVCPDGYYEITVSYHNADSPVESSFSYTVYLDSVPPTINSSEFIIDRDKARLMLDVTDDYGIAYISVSDSSLNSAPMTDDGSYDVGLLTGEYIYIEVCDLALNTTLIRLDNPLYLG